MGRLAMSITYERKGEAKGFWEGGKEKGGGGEEGAGRVESGEGERDRERMFRRYFPTSKIIPLLDAACYRLYLELILHINLLASIPY